MYESVDVDARSRVASHGNARPRASAAVLGAGAAFEDVLAVGRPNIPDKAAFLARVEGMVDARQLTNHGPMVRRFEAQVAEISGVRHCVATCNGTQGLDLAIEALGLAGEVIVPSFTFVASVHALWRRGVRPVFCDVDPRTHTLDPARVEEAVTPRTTGILAVALWGDHGHEGALRRIADRHGLRLLSDGAHAFACDRASAPRACEAEVLSFHATKCVNALEGGAILTDDDALAERLRLMVNFGFSGEDAVECCGTNAKMTEACAAMGLTSLEARDEIFARNRHNHRAYREGLAGVPALRVLTPDPGLRHNRHYVVVEVDAAAAGLDRDEIVGALRLENVLARRYFHPGCHRMEPYAGLPSGRPLPVTERLAAEVMVLPNGLAVAPADASLLASRVATLVERAAEVRAALAACDDPRLPAFARRHPVARPRKERA